MVVYYLYLETSLIRCYSNYYYHSRLVRYEKSQIKIISRSKLGYVSRRAYSSVTLYNNFTEITVEVLNKLLANQQVSITQPELEQLIKIPGPTGAAGGCGGRRKPREI